MNGVRVGQAPSIRAGMGATVYDTGVTFRVWAPHAADVAVVGLLGTDGIEIVVPLAPESAGLWSADIEGVVTGALYRFRIDGADPPQRNDPHC